MTTEQAETRKRLLSEGWKEIHSLQPAHWQFYERGTERIYVLPNGAVETDHPASNPSEHTHGFERNPGRGY